MAELHAERLRQGIPELSRPVAKQWAGIDLSWDALTAKDSNGEHNGSEVCNETDETPTADGLESDLGGATELPPPLAAAEGDEPYDGLPDWEAVLQSQRSNDTAMAPPIITPPIADSTMLQMKKALMAQAALDNSAHQFSLFLCPLVCDEALVTACLHMII